MELIGVIIMSKIKLCIIYLLTITISITTLIVMPVLASPETGGLTDEINLDVSINLMEKPGNNFLYSHQYLSSNTRMRGVESVEEGFQIIAGRFGHGVGMSQRGAQQMASAPHNKTFDEILAFYFEGTSLSAIESIRPELLDRKVRVLISISSPSISIALNGSYLLSELPDLVLNNGDYTVTLHQNNQIRLIGTGIDVLVPSSLTFISQEVSEEERSLMTIRNTIYGTVNYLGDMHFTINGNNLRVVNHVALEDYLIGVVPFEMSNSFPLEALKAQAVCARGYAVNNLRSSGTHDLVDTVTHQVYRGFNPSFGRAIRAINETRGLILTHNGRIISPYYSASNGGQTELAGNVWIENRPYLVQKDDPFDLENPHSIFHRFFVPRVVEGSGHEPVSVPGDYIVRIVKTNNNINVRSVPSTTGNTPIGTAPLNSAYEWLETVDGWHRIRFNGQEAFVSADFSARGENGRFVYANPVLADLQNRAFEALKSMGQPVERATDVLVTHVNNLVNGQRRWPNTESRAFVTANANITVRFFTTAIQNPTINSTIHRIGSNNITGVSPGLVTGTFLSNIGVNAGTVQLVSADGTARDTAEAVRTGDRLRLLDTNNQVHRELPIIILGDITGSGQITILDLLRLQRFLLNLAQLEGPFLQAADVNQNGTVDILDLLRLQRHLLGLTNITQ